jgi:hypothetical protein
MTVPGGSQVTMSLHSAYSDRFRRRRRGCIHRATGSPRSKHSDTRSPAPSIREGPRVVLRATPSAALRQCARRGASLPPPRKCCGQTPLPRIAAECDGKPGNVSDGVLPGIATGNFSPSPCPEKIVWTTGAGLARAALDAIRRASPGLESSLRYRWGPRRNSVALAADVTPASTIRFRSRYRAVSIPLYDPSLPGSLGGVSVSLRAQAPLKLTSAPDPRGSPPGRGLSTPWTRVAPRYTAESGTATRIIRPGSGVASQGDGAQPSSVPVDSARCPRHHLACGRLGNCFVHVA